ncbi:MAG: hypothetical protein IH588_08320 [Anaerolineales bacterium]|nr:hypothetical protein [Anaerolineales bacterium]
MKKIIYLLPLLLGILACGAQPQPPQNVSDIVNATLTAIAQNNLQVITPQTIIATTTIEPTMPGVILTTPSVPTAFSPIHTSTACSANWFFAFDNNHLSLASFCPEPAKLLEAVGQDFEGGRAYRYAPDPSYPADQRGTVYIIYNNGEWVTYPDNWDSSQPSSDTNLVAPNGRYQPVDSIGKVWRENADVRNRLGWAYESQSQFSGRFQSYLVQQGIPSGDTHFFFIDHGQWGMVLLLNSVDMGPNKWEVAGYYQ